VSTLERFQEETVKAAVAALGGGGARRFLVADEVGLGKTVVAREIASRLKGERRTFNLLYLCPSLQIAAQNRDKLVALTGASAEEVRKGAHRLTLSMEEPPVQGNGFKVFTFTPETSLPGWKPGARTGRKAERMLIRSLLDCLPQVRDLALKLDRAREAMRLLNERHHHQPNCSSTAFKGAMRAIFDCPGKPLDATIRVWLEREKNLPELISRMRSALALAALGSRDCRPDLIILDEFHRYADLILPQPLAVGADPIARDRARIHRLLISALLEGSQQPALLLLSATPYKLRKLSGQEIHPSDRYRALIDLVGFLTGAPKKRAAVEASMSNYQDALRREGDPATVTGEVLKAKRNLEALIRPVMARTERALATREDLFERNHISVSIGPNDLRVFRHFAWATANAPPRLKGWVPALWTSVPYPAQALHGYAIWPTLLKAARPTITFSTPGVSQAHPQLRGLRKAAGDEIALALPWQPPTLPWWILQGAWAGAKAVSGKTLLFSRWRAAPNVVSALLSLAIEPRGRTPSGKARQPLLRPGGSASSALMGLFAPWPRLSLAVDPPKGRSMTVARLRAVVRSQLVSWLKERGFTIGGKGKRPTWRLAFGIERALGDDSFRRLRKLLTDATPGNAEAEWKEVEAVSRVSEPEVTALAHALVAWPGAILARSLHRHGANISDRPVLDALFDLGWHRLRPYLGHRPFTKAIFATSKRTRYPDALIEAMVKGGFEAAIDEHIAVLVLVADKKGVSIATEIKAGMIDRPGRVRLRSGSKDRSIAVHAAMPFAGGERRGGRGGKLRSDTLRRAFNSPFWPHLLATTSVGQEGLDFHIWCRRIVHWDLPTDPVDFEQREGRIARYGSLAVRRSLAGEFGDEALATCSNGSPFRRLFNLARKRKQAATGLETWWLPLNDKPESVTFNWKFSIKSARMEDMLEGLLHYRLALGQPDPDRFSQLLRRIDAKPELARALAIDLSALRGSRSG
jgi:hypothetical protein